MCTAIVFKCENAYFGRTLDLEHTYNEKVTVTPRNFLLSFRKKESIASHYAIIGMATVIDSYPLYYEAANEHGLGMAGLNFPDNAFYGEEKEGKDNITPFEFIPWVLAQCKSVDETEKLLKKINLCNINFSDRMPLTPLHWMITDRERALTVEAVSDGIKIYENKIGVLTNSPAFPYHMTYLLDFANLTADSCRKTFAGFDVLPYSRGLGAKGLPGDLSSTSRFVRAAFTLLNSFPEKSENDRVSQFFHILGAVEQVKGAVRLPDGKNVITQYTSCINLDKGIYYYTTYENRCVSAVDMHKCHLDGDKMTAYSLEKKLIINRKN